MNNQTELTVTKVALLNVISCHGLKLTGFNRICCLNSFSSCLAAAASGSVWRIK